MARQDEGERRKRLAEALRANLRLRKAAAVAPAETGTSLSAPGQDTRHDAGPLRREDRLVPRLAESRPVEAMPKKGPNLPADGSGHGKHSDKP